MSRYARALRRGRGGADRRGRTPTSAWRSRAGRRWSTQAARTCPAASSSPRRSRTRPKARSSSASSRPSTTAARCAGSGYASRAGKVVDASAEANEEFLLEQLDLDEGARRLGELGIGCNPGITRHMKNTLFDEKIDGTVHLALGNGLPEVGGEERQPAPLGHRQGDAPRTRSRIDGEPVQDRAATVRTFATMVSRGGSRVFSCLRARTLGSKEEKIEVEGEVVESLPSTMFRVQVDGMDGTVLATIAGRCASTTSASSRAIA